MIDFLNFRAQQTSYIVILCTTKIPLLPRFLKCTFLACFDRDMFRSKYARRVRPCSFSMLCRWRHWGRGIYLLPLQRHTRETSLSTWLPMPVLNLFSIIGKFTNLSTYFKHSLLSTSLWQQTMREMRSLIFDVSTKKKLGKRICLNVENLVFGRRPSVS